MAGDLASCWAWLFCWQPHLPSGFFSNASLPSLFAGWEQELVVDAGLAGNCTCLLNDYRGLEGRTLLL